MLSGKQHADFGMPGFLLQFLNLAREIRQDIFSFSRQFGKCFQVLDILYEPRIQLDILVQTAPLLQDGLRLLLIIPEFRFGYFFFEFKNLRTLVVCIKDTLELAVFFPRLRSPSPEVLRASIPPKSFIYES
jgi:hypothetical protein